MVTLLIGCPGSGKTKQLVRLVNEAVDSSDGNVVCIEKKRKLTYEVRPHARLIAADDYGIAGYDAFYGFLSGICAGDHDITDVFVDATLRIGSRDYNALLAFLKKCGKLSKSTDTRFIFTISANEAELPAEIFDVCKRFALTAA